MNSNLICGDALTELRTLPSASVQAIITSPPYWGQRDYEHVRQIGLETMPTAYLARLVEVFAAARRVLSGTGTLWLNIGDTYCADATIRERGRRTIDADRRHGEKPSKWSDYASRSRVRYAAALRSEGLKPKDLIGIPWRLALALQADGWYLRSAIIWHCASGKERTVDDRPRRSYEYLFLLSKSENYLFQRELLAPQHQLDVWVIHQAQNTTNHVAVMPDGLVEPCIIAGTQPSDVVLDPFAGVGTVCRVAKGYGRRYIGIELNEAYYAEAQRQLDATPETLWSA